MLQNALCALKTGQIEKCLIFLETDIPEINMPLKIVRYAETCKIKVQIVSHVKYTLMHTEEACLKY